jgi:glycerol-3-phosphate dehydrogenase (NAD(P)+)
VKPVAILGAGSWGTALAVHMARSGREVRLWARDAAHADEIRRTRVNPRYLSEVSIPESVRPMAALDEAVRGIEIVILAVPTHGVRGVMREAAPLLAERAVLVSAAKGLETESLMRMSQVLAAETADRHPVVVLSGPSFSAEVARGLPTAVLAASTDAAAAEIVQEQFRGRGFRLYGSDDVAGVEIGGALKNVIAIAAG